MAVPRVRMFAGPNGSGKTSLIQSLKSKNIPLGPILNADNLLERLEKLGYLDLKDFKLSSVNQSDWKESLKDIKELKSRVEKAGKIPKIKISEDMLICKKGDLNVYTVALIADFLRYSMLDQQVSFSFETVMSHPGKIDFLEIAKQKGCKTYLYFIATDDPSINVSRVENRVRKGGHPVPKEIKFGRVLATLMIFIVLNTICFL